MKVVFRADASHVMGTGHVMRSLTLANLLRERGAETQFISRAHPGNLFALLQHQNMPVTGLPAPKETSGVHEEDCAAWLGMAQAEDAEQTIEALHGDIPDWLIVDHYGLSADWERKLRAHAVKIMVIDDLANSPHDCDLLLNQNFSDGNHDRYGTLLPHSCGRLLGPRYALLRPEYAAYHHAARPRDGTVHRVLVFFGGSDVHNLTGVALEALSQPELQHLEVAVVVGTNNPNQPAVENLAAARPRTTVHAPLPHLADLMAEADLGIGAAGATTWERICVGLPSIVVSIANNQKPACKALSHAGMIDYVGDVTQVRMAHLQGALRKWIGNDQGVIKPPTHPEIVVDGLGAQRIAEVLDPTLSEHLHLRTAREDDVELYFEWANDPEVRRQAIHTQPIPWEEHRAWFSQKLADTQSHLFILKAGTLPVGQIRFDQDGDVARISYSLDMLARGRHWAGRLISMGARMLQDSAPIHAKQWTFHLHADVKTTNAASCAAFIRLGFEEQPATVPGMRVFRSVSSR